MQKAVLIAALSVGLLAPQTASAESAHPFAGLWAEAAEQCKTGFDAGTEGLHEISAKQILFGSTQCAIAKIEPGEVGAEGAKTWNVSANCKLDEESYEEKLTFEQTGPDDLLILYADGGPQVNDDAPAAAQGDDGKSTPPPEEPAATPPSSGAAQTPDAAEGEDDLDIWAQLTRCK